MLGWVNGTWKKALQQHNTTKSSGKRKTTAAPKTA
jgi:hypothetical protein